MPWEELGKNERWTPSTLIDTAVGGDKTLTVPAGKEYIIEHIYMTYAATAVVGNRAPQIYFSTSTTSDKFSIIYMPTITAGQSKAINLGPDFPNDAAYPAPGALSLRLPKVTLKAGDKIRFVDGANIDKLNDTWSYWARILERNV